jgi:hypothetical protein
VSVEITPERASGVLRITASAATTGPTGVEMEALTAVSVAALTVYDMVKSAERGVTIQSIRLLEKSGGAGGTWRRTPARPRREPPGPASPRGDRSATRGTDDAGPPPWEAPSHETVVRRARAPRRGA